MTICLLLPWQYVCILQALLHPYFFTEPLPAHHSELPIPQKSTKKARNARHAHEYNIEVPLENSLVDPDAINPHVSKK